MRFYYPSSFLKLILAAFALVTLPLMLSTTHGTLSVSRLSNQSEEAVRRAVLATQSSWMLVQHLTAMERVARQWVVLGDASLLQEYGKSRAPFLESVAALSSLALEPRQRAQLMQLIDQESAVHAVLSQSPQAGEAVRLAVGQFPGMSERAQSILSGTDRIINHEMNALQTMASNARRRLVLESLSVIPVALLLAGGFAFLIARPIRQIDDAIHRLGRGEFDRSVTVSGPQDLQHLGRRLEWLRVRLLDLEAQRSKLLHHVSHELKTPLAALREGSQLLADGVVGAPTPQQAEIVQILRQSTLQLQKRIDDLLTFKLTQSQADPVTRQRVALPGLLDRVLRSHQPMIMRNALQVHVDATPVEVMADERELLSVIDNLLSNAIKYSTDGEAIHVHVRREGLLAVLEVVDKGPGIDADEREQVFEAFYQGRAAQEGEVAGTGLGLAIAREYVLAHGGHIEVIDKPGPGAHMRVTLPACVEGKEHE